MSFYDSWFWSMFLEDQKLLVEIKHSIYHNTVTYTHKYTLFWHSSLSFKANFIYESCDKNLCALLQCFDSIRYQYWPIRMLEYVTGQHSMVFFYSLTKTAQRCHLMYCNVDSNSDMSIKLMQYLYPFLISTTWVAFHIWWASVVFIALYMLLYQYTRWDRCLCMIGSR